MTEVSPAREEALPAAVPLLLSFVAGYVDSYTYLALFGLFVAQVTGSFVIAAFLAAAAMTAALIGLLREAGRAALPTMLGLEAALLAAFVAIILFGPPIDGATNWHGIAAGLFAAMAMGAQSVLVRLLMKGIPQTNVMTGNMTQLGIETTALVLSWRRVVRDPDNAAAVREFAAVRARLSVVLSVALGFLFGAAIGAAVFAVTNVRGAPVAAAIVGALALWSLYRERRA